MTIGWAGSITHLADWFATAHTVARWIARHPDACLAVTGPESAREFVRLPPEQYAFTPLGTHEEYRRFLTSLDVAVVPLADTPFNRGRTALKFWDLAASGVVGVFEANGPYPKAIEHGVSGWSYSTPQELLELLNGANDSQIREHAYAKAARQSLEVPARVRMDSYRELLNAAPTGAAIPTSLETSASFDDRHVQFENGEPERIVSEAVLSGEVSLLAKLIGVNAEWPEYIPARRARSHSPESESKRASPRGVAASDAVRAGDAELTGGCCRRE